MKRLPKRGRFSPVACSSRQLGLSCLAVCLAMSGRNMGLQRGELISVGSEFHGRFLYYMWHDCQGGEMEGSKRHDMRYSLLA
jgi:hypothetical protein